MTRQFFPPPRFLLLAALHFLQEHVDAIMHINPCVASWAPSSLGTTPASFPKIRLTRVEHTPRVIRTNEPLSVKFFGVSNADITSLGGFKVRVFFCRRFQDCMSVQTLEGDLCDHIERGPRYRVGGIEEDSDHAPGSGREGKSDEEDSSFFGSFGGSRGSSDDKDGASDEDEEESAIRSPKDCSLSLFETFSLRFDSRQPLPVDIFRGSYDLEIELEKEEACLWIQDVNVVAGDLHSSLTDYRDVILSFVVASSSSFMIGQYVPVWTRGLIPQITGFLLMGIVLGPFGTSDF